MQENTDETAGGVRNDAAAANVGNPANAAGGVRNDAAGGNVRIAAGWRRALAAEWGAPYFAELTARVREVYAAYPGLIYPPAGRVFAAFDAADFNDVRVVILGQDPYHGAGQANGLAFSVAPGVAVPPSLRNILAEVKADVGHTIIPDGSGDLTPWARQGVLLLNATLTVSNGRPASHQGMGWERFTDAAVERLSAERSGLVFMLWGAPAARKGRVIDTSRHLVLTCPHPSPLSAHRGFFGCRHFSQANAYLQANGQKPIEW